jgi:hypothetical protein
VWGAFTLQNSSWNLRGQLDNSKVPHELFDPAKYAATSGENLAGKPACQRDYVDKYPKIFQPVTDPESYRRFYYQLQQNVNDQIQRVLDALNAHPRMAQNTIVIFTSDHGELLGAHEGPVYFLTEDEVSRGSDQVTPLGFEYESVIQPNTVESIVTYLPTGEDPSRPSPPSRPQRRPTRLRPTT